MSKIYEVIAVFRKGGTRHYSYPHPFDERFVRIFPTKDSATRWVEDNFTRYVNYIPSFCDFLIVGEELRNYENDISKVAIEPRTWVAARLSEDLKYIEITGFEKEKSEYVEHTTFSNRDREYVIFYRLPLTIRSRKDIINYIKKRIEIEK